MDKDQVKKEKLRIYKNILLLAFGFFLNFTAYEVSYRLLKSKFTETQKKNLQLYGYKFQ